MTLFALAALALTALTLAAIARPLWRDARGWALSLSLAVPLLCLGLYALVGTPEGLSANTAGIDAERTSEPTLEQALVGLRARLLEQPDDLDGWLLLGRSLRVQADFEGSRDALAQAYRLAPDQPDVQVEYAEAMVLANPERRIDGEPLRLIEQALATDPRHQRGLLLLGAQQIQAGRPAEGASTWERLLDLVPPETRPALRERIDTARAQAGQPPLPTEAEDDPPSLRIELDLAPALAEAVPPDAVLFLLARPVDGPGIPFAARRLPVGDFPRTITLGDADSPMPSARLFDQPRVRLIARISRAGQAERRAGDLEGTLEIVPEPGARIALRIDRVVE